MKCKECGGDGKGMYIRGSVEQGQDYGPHEAGGYYTRCPRCNGSGEIPRRSLPLEERLIVAADFKPNPEQKQGRGWVKHKVLELAQRLAWTGVYLKVNSALRSAGYDLVPAIQAYGLKVFADLKLFDIGETLETDGVLLCEVRPDIVTVACAAGVEAMSRLKKALPDAEILGITVLTTFDDDDSKAMFSCDTEEAVQKMATFAKRAGTDGLICSPAEVKALQEKYEVLFSLNTPGVRFADVKVAGDDQNQARVMTPELSIRAGADRVVMGRPITQAANPMAAVERALREIELGLS